MERSGTYTDWGILAHNLLWLRKKHGYSQKVMAQRLGIGVGSLRRLEHGDVPPRLTIEFLFAVEACFHIAPSALLAEPLE